MPLVKPISIDFKTTGGTPITSIQGGNDIDITVGLDGTTTSATNVTVGVPSAAPISGPLFPNPITGQKEEIVGVPIGDSSVTIRLSADTVSSNTVVTFSAEANGTTVQGNLTVTP